MVGDGSFYTLTVCPQDGVYPQFFVAIHTNMNCQVYLLPKHQPVENPKLLVHAARMAMQ